MNIRKNRFFYLSLHLSLLLLVSLCGCSKEDLWSRFNPGSVSDVTVTAVTSSPTTLDLAWDIPSGEDIVSVTVSWTDGTTSQSASSTAQTYSITTGLVPGTEYEITLVAVDRYGIRSEGLTLSFMWNATNSEAHEIYSADDMNAVRGGVTGYSDWDLGDTYYLMADIDLSAYASGPGWDPIGHYGTPFTGGFYGNGHTISGLVINDSANDYKGLFGYSDGPLKDVTIAGASVAGGVYVGVLAGYSTASIENVTVDSATITAQQRRRVSGYS
jgi:hypothetical protein